MEEYTIDNPNVVVTEYGPAPLDKIIIIEYQENDLFFSVYSDPEINRYLASKKSYIECIDNDMNINDFLIECYDELQEATDSEYYHNYTALDEKLNVTWKKIKEHAIDTRYSGIQSGASYENDGIFVFAEAFNHNQPEHKEYIQVRSKNGEYIYSASHESYYMKYQLGDFYQAYFGEPPQESYFINISDLNDLDRKYYYFSESFRHLKKIISEKAFANGLLKIDEIYDPVVTSIKGIYNSETQIIEMTLDNSKTSRLYLSIHSASNHSTIYRVTKRSTLDTNIEEFPQSDCVEEQESISKLNNAFKSYFNELKEAYNYMIKSHQNYLWRYGDGDKYKD